MNESFNEKIKKHIEYMMNLKKEEFIDYSFDKYKEYETDLELSSFFLMEIGKTLLNISGNNLRNILKLKPYDKKYIKEALYKYYYEDNKSYKGPLNNLFGELLDEKVTVPYVEPYLNLITILLNSKKENISKIF